MEDDEQRPEGLFDETSRHNISVTTLILIRTKFWYSLYAACRFFLFFSLSLSFFFMAGQKNIPRVPPSSRYFPTTTYGLRVSPPIFPALEYFSVCTVTHCGVIKIRRDRREVKSHPLLVPLRRHFGFFVCFTVGSSIPALITHLDFWLRFIIFLQKPHYCRGFEYFVVFRQKFTISKDTHVSNGKT